LYRPRLPTLAVANLGDPELSSALPVPATKPNFVRVNVMHKALKFALVAGVAALGVSLSDSASATPTAFGLRQGQAMGALVPESVGYRRWYRRHAYGYPYYYRPYYRPYAFYRPYPYYYRPWYRPGVSFWFGF
jgi:hypothetical protein